MFHVYCQEVDEYRNLIGRYQICIADMKNIDECKAAELLGKVDACMQRAYITEIEAAVADSFVKYAADTKKRHKAIEGAHNRCVLKGGDLSCSIAAFWHVTKSAIVAREESSKKKQKTWKSDVES